MGKLGDSFARHFQDAFAEGSSDLELAKSDWLGPSKRWTKRMLDPEGGVLSIAARNWAREQFSSDNHQILCERRKIDLMLVSGASDDLWQTAPLLLVEHENADDVEVEAWNLACWRAPLRVLVFYCDKSDRTAKFERIAQVLRRIEGANAPGGEFLFITAPWRFADGLRWRFWEWQGDEVAPIGVSA